MAGTYKIMIADDFPILREDLAEVIREQPDMEVVGEASTGKEIVALAESMDYDLILMDIEMETMNAGITATEMIRDKNPQAKIIFLTAHELREIIITAMGAGALDYIVKGCSDEEILYHIRCALEGHPVMQGQIQQTVMQEYARLQREIIRLLLEGRKVHEIAGIRCVENSTIKTQIKSLLGKFGCSRTKEIVQVIRELNIEHLF